MIWRPIAYNRVPRDDPSFHAAELGRAEALRDAGKDEAAIEVLEQLAKSHAGFSVGSFGAGQCVASAGALRRGGRGL